MKRIIILFLFSLTISFQSCVVSYTTFCAINNEEIIQLNKDGSGSYSLKLDLNDFIDMLTGMSGDRSPIEMYKSVNIDTLILFNKFLADFSLNLDEKEKAMFKDGSVKIKCNISKGEESVLIKLFYSNPDQLDFAREHIFSFISRNSDYAFSLFTPETDSDIDSISKELMKQLGVTEPKPDFRVESPGEYNIIDEALEIKGFNPVGKAFSFNITQDSIQNDLTDLSLFEKTISSNKSLKNVKKENHGFDKVFFRTTFVVPKEIKNYKGSLESISSDKKTITFKNSLLEILTKPKSTEFFVSF